MVRQPVLSNIEGLTTNGGINQSLLNLFEINRVQTWVADEFQRDITQKWSNKNC